VIASSNLILIFIIKTELENYFFNKLRKINYLNACEESQGYTTMNTFFLLFNKKAQKKEFSARLITNPKNTYKV
jgi:hypothetical protein